MDGYAGTGRYDTGEPASAELIMRTASGFTRRHVRAYFVEAKRSNFAKLERAIREYHARGVDALARCGRVEDHLPEILADAAGVPLFLFLDPCGAVVPHQVLVRLLQRQRGEVRPATEVLLNFSADLTRRTVSALAKGPT